MALALTTQGTADLANTTEGTSHDGTIDCGTVTTGAMLIVAAGGTGGTVGTTWTTPTKSSGTATIGTAVQIGSTAGGGTYQSTVMAWRIPITTGGTLVLSIGDGNQSFGAHYHAIQYTGQDSTTPIAGAVTQYNATDGGDLANSTLGATPTADDEVVAIVNYDTDAGAGKGITPGTNFTERYDTGATDDYVQMQTATRAGSVSTSTTVVWGTQDDTPASYEAAGLAFIVKAGAVSPSGTMAVTQAAQTSTISGTITFTATMAVTQAAQTMSATGTGDSTLTGTMAVTQAAQTSSASGTITFTATMAVTQDAQTMSASGTGGTTTFTATLAVTQAAQTMTAVGVAFNGVYPASVSGREILDQNGNPYPVQGVAVWTATQNLTDANITTMLEGVAAQGLNSVMMAPCGLLWNDPAGTAAANRYENYAGDPFFTGTAFASSLGSAWSSVDHFMDEAARLGLTVWFCWYAGNLSTYGQSDEWSAATNAQVRTVGSDVATRYPVSVYPNLVWVFGADASFSAASTIGQRLDSIARGIADVETSRLTVAHPDKRDNGTYDSGRDQFGTGYTYLTIDINSIYSYQDDFADQFDSVYAEASVPVINIEPVYVHNTGQEPGSGPVSHGSGQGAHLREQAWVAFARGGNGIMHGDEDLWPFGATGLYSGGGTWQQVLDHAAGTHDNPLIWLGHLWDFLAANPSWSDLAPDADTFLTSGEGTVNNRASAGLAGDLAIVYFPNTRGSIVVDTTQLTGTSNVRLRWFDPTDGSYTSIAASEAQNASRSITYPTTNTNSNSSDDWVLVVDLLNDATGSMAVTQAAQTSSITGTITLTGSMAVTQAAQTSAITGVESFTGTTATTQAAQTMAATGVESFTGATAVTQAAQTSTISGTITFTGTMAVTQAAQTMTASGISGSNPTAVMAVTQADQTSTISGTITVTCTATMAVTQANQTMSATGNDGSVVVAIYGPALTAAPPPILTWSPPPILTGRSS